MEREEEGSQVRGKWCIAIYDLGCIYTKEMYDQENKMPMQPDADDMPDPNATE